MSTVTNEMVAEILRKCRFSKFECLELIRQFESSVFHFYFLRDDTRSCDRRLQVAVAILPFYRNPRVALFFPGQHSQSQTAFEPFVRSLSLSRHITEELTLDSPPTFIVDLGYEAPCPTWCQMLNNEQ